MPLPAPVTRHVDPSSIAAWTCARCHTTRDWTKIPDRVAFDHGTTGTVLTGAHARAACSRCHRPSDSQSGKVPKACASCHADVHRGELGARCTDCHNTLSWGSPRSLPSHERTRLPLTGAHTAVECRACHTRLGREVFRGTPTVCRDCHAQVALQVRQPDHRLVGFGAGCGSCHSTFAWSPASVQHGLWWPLEGRHAAAACLDCHGNGKWRGQATACVACHADDYAAAQPNHQAFGLSTACQTCHTPAAWAAVRSSWHEAAFPIRTGKHVGLACADCHGSGRRGGAPAACTSCHSHAQPEMAQAHGEVAGYVWQSQACLGCHPRGKVE